MLAVATVEGLHELEANPQLLQVLRANIKFFRSAFGASRHVTLHGHDDSPMMHLRLTKPLEKRDVESALLQRIVDMVRVCVMWCNCRCRVKAS
jgi:7-keto-8-aminopelargonate synthetase-like enzyme